MASGLIKTDFGAEFRDTTINSRLVWEVDADIHGIGAHIIVESAGYTTKVTRALLLQGDHELFWGDPGQEHSIPMVLEPSVPPALSISGQTFMQHGQPFRVKGSTDFRLGERVHAGVDIRPILKDRKDAGANWLRVLGMKQNNTGWQWLPNAPGRRDAMRRLFDLAGQFGFYVEWVTFADTALLMPTLAEQLTHREKDLEVLRQYPFVLEELLNEYGHSLQRVEPSKFSKPSGIIASHGSGLTDRPAVAPYWDYATYHGRRMAYANDSRAAVAYSPYGFEEEWRKPCPFVNEESAKPQSYGYDPHYARLMGLHARCGTGGTFHGDWWNEPRLYAPEERRCAVEFYSALD